MPTIAFTIDPTTGELTVHIQGIAGPGCDDIARLLRELSGSPSQEHETEEYHLSRVRPRVTPQGNQGRGRGGGR